MTPAEFKTTVRDRVAASWLLTITMLTLGFIAREKIRTENQREQARHIADAMHDYLCAIREELAEINARARRLTKRAGEQ